MGETRYPLWVGKDKKRPLRGTDQDVCILSQSDASSAQWNVATGTLACLARRQGSGRRRL